MIKYAILPGFENVTPPEYSHGDSNSSMCIDMYAAKAATFSKNSDSLSFVDISDLSSPQLNDEMSSAQVLVKKMSTGSFNPGMFSSELPYALVNTGIVFELPKGLHLSWAGRSGSAFKNGVMAFEGKIDAAYRGEVKALLWSLNSNYEGVEVAQGEKFAQMQIVDYRTESERLVAFCLEHSTEALISMIENILPYKTEEELYFYEPDLIMSSITAYRQSKKEAGGAIDNDSITERTIRLLYGKFLMGLDSSLGYTLRQVPYSEINKDTTRGEKGFGSTGKGSTLN